MNTSTSRSPVLTLCLALALLLTHSQYASAQEKEDAGQEEVAAEASVSFSNDVQPIFDMHCVFCHQSAAAQGGLVLQQGMAYEQLVDVKSSQSELLRVAPGDREASYLLHKLRGTHLSVGGEGSAMPLGGPSLSEEQIELIGTWIEEGAVAE